MRMRVAQQLRLEGTELAECRQQRPVELAPARVVPSVDETGENVLLLACGQ